MEQSKPYLMWMKSKQLLSSSSPISWEEQAFAEDASGPFVWPPRSYSCTFCNREFRSAQALGGHMNVHRRDRARLKQQSASLSDENDSSSSPKNSDQETDIQEPFSANKKRVSFPSSSNSPRHDDSQRRSWINLDDDDVVETNLCVGMKSYGGSKRLRSGAATSSSFYHKRPCSSSSIDDVIDLELRLGDSPAAVK